MLMRRQRIQFESDTLRKFPPHSRYLIGVSGGRDSVALLHWLISFGYERLIVCHLNHRLRGRSSDADARFVKRLIERYKQVLLDHRRYIVEHGIDPPEIVDWTWTS